MKIKHLELVLCHCSLNFCTSLIYKVVKCLLL
jgi:hypothetical protein